MRIIISFLLPFLAGAIGSLATYPAIPTWYASLIKPSWNPPNFLFGPVWTILYILMGVSFYLVISQKKNKMVRLAIQPYYVQLILNTLWSIVFFGFKDLYLALINIAFLWIFIVLTILDFYKVKKLAAYLMIPYLLWVSFAAFLNLTVYLLNR
jgi:translocator protein